MDLNSNTEPIKNVVRTKMFPDSTNIVSISHQGTTLTVEFRRTGHYEYYDVPVEVYEEAIKATSIGSWIFQKLVKGSYKWRRI